jgi:hypothetical protein
MEQSREYWAQRREAAKFRNQSDGSGGGFGSSSSKQSHSRTPRASRANREDCTERQSGITYSYSQIIPLPTESNCPFALDKMARHHRWSGHAAVRHVGLWKAQQAWDDNSAKVENHDVTKTFSLPPPKLDLDVTKTFSGVITGFEGLNCKAVNEATRCYLTVCDKYGKRDSNYAPRDAYGVIILGETHEQMDDAVIMVEEILQDVHKFDAVRAVQLKFMAVATGKTAVRRWEVPWLTCPVWWHLEHMVHQMLKKAGGALDESDVIYNLSGERSIREFLNNNAKSPCLVLNDMVSA